MTQHKKKPVIGITIGDINGIGAEVTLKALADNRLLRLMTPVIYAHGKALTFYRKALQLEDFNFMQVKGAEAVHHKKINVINVVEESPEVHPGVETREAGKMALAAMDQAIADAKAGLIDAIVTAPLNKHTIHTEEKPFVGHTEYFTEAFEAKDSLMFLCANDMRVGLATGHIPLAQVASALTEERLTRKLELMLESLKTDFGIAKPKVAVLGLNPHAGEGGVLGQEEQELISPVINRFKENGEYVFGPYPADGFFGMMHQRKFDGVLAMYHDQGLAPFKALAFESGVNFTAGLSLIRTSPDHGTAYNIAGKGIADESSMRAALYLALEVIRHRNPWEEEEEEE
ncbi:MAG: 4-hydroxythreonine-4-phosphate dehydrogenase PdxA [Nitritalea sp.]